MSPCCSPSRRSSAATVQPSRWPRAPHRRPWPRMSRPPSAPTCCSRAAVAPTPRGSSPPAASTAPQPSLASAVGAALDAVGAVAARGPRRRRRSASPRTSAMAAGCGVAGRGRRRCRNRSTSSSPRPRSPPVATRGRHASSSSGRAAIVPARATRIAAELGDARRAVRRRRRRRRRRYPEVVAALTKAERRVAEAVAAGRTNREVADHLFVSVKTVDFHLQAIYRKLEVRSRTELAVLMATRSSRDEVDERGVMSGRAELVAVDRGARRRARGRRPGPVGRRRWPTQRRSPTTRRHFSPACRPAGAAAASPRPGGVETGNSPGDDEDGPDVPSS